jgi:hypothetical protein
MVGVAQLVEHRVVVPGVAGSSPVAHPMQSRRSAVFRATLPPSLGGSVVLFGGDSVMWIKKRSRQHPACWRLPDGGRAFEPFAGDTVIVDLAVPGSSGPGRTPRPELSRAARFLRLHRLSGQLVGRENGRMDETGTGRQRQRRPPWYGAVIAVVGLAFIVVGIVRLAS